MRAIKDELDMARKVNSNFVKMHKKSCTAAKTAAGLIDKLWLMDDPVATIDEAAMNPRSRGLYRLRETKNGKRRNASALRLSYSRPQGVCVDPQ